MKGHLGRQKSRDGHHVRQLSNSMLRIQSIHQALTTILIRVVLEALKALNLTRVVLKVLKAHE